MGCAPSIKKRYLDYNKIMKLHDPENPVQIDCFKIYNQYVCVVAGSNVDDELKRCESQLILRIPWNAMTKESNFLST
jgi:hypothetical protein